jgi:hypothetical protein
MECDRGHGVDNPVTTLRFVVLATSNLREGQTIPPTGTWKNSEMKTASYPSNKNKKKKKKRR